MIITVLTVNGALVQENQKSGKLKHKVVSKLFVPVTENLFLFLILFFLITGIHIHAHVAVIPTQTKIVL